jgi:hypothetical protein
MSTAQEGYDSNLKDIQLAVLNLNQGTNTETHEGRKLKNYYKTLLFKNS